MLLPFIGQTIHRRPYKIDITHLIEDYSAHLALRERVWCNQYFTFVYLQPHWLIFDPCRFFSCARDVKN
jgi:hypothetical protein